MFSRFGEEGLQSTFVMANVIPQYHDLNAGEWEHLESAISGRDGQGGGLRAVVDHQRPALRRPPGQPPAAQSQGSRGRTSA